MFRTSKTILFRSSGKFNTRLFSISNQITRKIINEQQKSKKTLGQPTWYTHPHMVQQGEVAPGIQYNEFQQRRNNLLNLILNHSAKFEKHAGGHLVVIPSATKRYMSDKIPYVFRQNSDFYYLSGCLEPDSCLVLYANANVQKSTIFMRRKDSHSEMWDGPRTGTEHACELFGVDEALANDEFEQFLLSYLKTKNIMLWYDYLNAIQPDVDKQITQMFKRVKWDNPIHFVHQLRLIKSPAEIKLMRQSCQIASDAFEQTMKHSKPGCCEHELFARIDYECRLHGAEYLAYPPVVAGGNRANTIHYINNNQIINDGELVLMDAGCEYHGYCSDITRTWPVNGSYTDQQRVLYEILLNVQDQLIQLCHRLPTLDYLFEAMCTLLGQRLSEQHIIAGNLSADEKTKMAYKFCPHHVSHYLGMDVHDTTSISRKINLKPGMIVTMEPGIYIPYHYNVPHEFKGLGLRVEDDILITDNDVQILSENCPRTIETIEQIVKESK